MSRVLGTRRYLLLLVCILAVLGIHQATKVVLIVCPSVERDWYPSVKPQNSSPPYVLNVTDDEGRSVHEDRFNDGPLYGPGQRTYTSENFH